MIAARGVGPLNAWLPGSSSPRYASTSTRRAARPSERTKSLPTNSCATSPASRRKNSLRSRVPCSLTGCWARGTRRPHRHSPIRPCPIVLLTDPVGVAARRMREGTSDTRHAQTFRIGPEHRCEAFQLDCHGDRPGPAGTSPPRDRDPGL